MELGKYLELQRKLSEFYINRVQPKLKLHNEAKRKKDINLIILYSIIISIIVCVITSIFKLFPLQLFSIFTFIVGTAALIIRAERTIEFDIDTDLKIQLMDDFVKIFGDLHWYNLNISNKILEDKLYKLKKRNSNLANIAPEYLQITKSQQALYTNIWSDVNKIKELNIFNVLGISFDDCIDGRYENVPFSIKEITVIPPAVADLGCLISFIPVISFFGIIIALILLVAGLQILGLYYAFIDTIVKLGASKITATLIAATIFVLSIKFIINIIAKLYRHRSTGFRGVMIEFDMNKNFEGHTFILDNTKDGKAINVNKNEYSEVKLEDIEFEKDYTIWSNNQIEARYLLTTTFIERLKNLKTSFKAQYTRVSFKDNKIVIAIHTGRDMFKMANAFSKTGKETFIELFKEIASVLDFIEQLKLNKKIGL
ncbi:MAG: DUF3137 domain-containing protein [Candidatus Gastranaerophilaceae bacterium]